MMSDDSREKTSIEMAASFGGPWKTIDGTQYPTEEARDDVTHASYPTWGCVRHEQCRDLPNPFPKRLSTIGDVEDAIVEASAVVHEAIVAIENCQHPTSGVILNEAKSVVCTACNLKIADVADLVGKSHRANPTRPSSFRDDAAELIAYWTEYKWSVQEIMFSQTKRQSALVWALRRAGAAADMTACLDLVQAAAQLIEGSDG